MDLRKKTLLNLSIALTVIIIAIIVFSSTFLLTSYQKLESDRVQSDVNLVLKNLNGELSGLNSLAMDMAAWDDAYAFVRGEKPDFIEINYGKTTFSRQNLNIVIITNTRGDILYAQGYDYDTKEMVPVPKSVLDEVASVNSPLRNLTPKGSVLGFLNIPEGPVLIASYPVLHSDFSGPAAGVVIIGRGLYKDEMSRLSSEDIIPFLAISSLDSPSVPESDRILLSHRGNNSFAIHPEEEGVIGAYQVIKDVHGNDTILLRMEESRDIYQKGLSTILTFIIIQLAAGLFLGVLIFYLIDKRVLRRIQTISTDFKEITDKGDLSTRIKVEGDDELTRLADVSNQMLDQIEQADKLVRLSEERFRTVFEKGPLGMVIVDETFRFVKINPMFCSMMGYSEAELLQKTFADITHPDSHKTDITQVKKPGAGEISEYTTEKRYIKKNGDVIWASVTVSAVRDEKGAFLYYLALIGDVTDRKKMEEHIRQSLMEKEVLLKEIHHRVKNNMQVISSLLSMQARTIQDESIRALLKESQNRIQSIALVHEQLYRSDSLYQIEYGGYIRKMFNPLFESYNADQQRISMHIDAQNVMITIEKAVPCSLIINELISNSLKHAFPQGRKGEIHIGFSLDEASGTYILDYRDNGVGIPPGKDLTKTGSLGMQLIYGLTRQLSGTITLEPAEGVHFIIRFPSKEKDKE